ncbi:MAG: haloalkane dehalogenase [Bradyrhizobium sp.]|nr:haloalkane dehalogenase [Bradyrhizobium sp.]
MDTGRFADKKFIEIKGHRMAYIDEGEGAPIVFQHGNPTSSYLWRKVMPACVGLGRLIACDLIGMGDSDKLSDSGPHRYTFSEQREFLTALWEELGLDRDVVLVMHDWGGVLGLDWARQNSDRVQAVAYMEAPPLPLVWSDFPNDVVRGAFRLLRSEAGEEMIPRDNKFLEEFFFHQEQDTLSEADKAEYRRPFLNPGEDRRAMLSFPRQIPVDGTPADVSDVMTAYADWLKESAVPKLWVRGNPGFLVTERFAKFWESLPNQTVVEVKGAHFLPEASGPAIGAAVADFVRSLRT